MISRDGKQIDSPEESRDEDGGNETALIPKSIVAGYDLEVGDQIKFKVVSIMEDELEIEYAHKSDDGKDDEPKSDMDSANDELDSMAQEAEA